MTDRSNRRLIVVGLDAVEAPVLQEMMGNGEAPNLARLAQSGVDTPVTTSCMDTLPGAIWQDILTGRSVGDHADYYPQRLHTGEAEPRPIDPAQHGGTYVWDRLAERGVPSVVIDPPLGHTYPGISDLVTMVCEWHVHDANYGRVSHPPELVEELERTHGVRPTDRCDFLVDGSVASYTEFVELLEREARIKGDVALELLEARPWEFAFVGMSQGHCAGHHLWQFHDLARRDLDSNGLGDGVRRVYAALDDVLGRLIERFGDDTDLIVLTSHGMENYVGGPQLLADVLMALDYGDPRKIPSWLRPYVPSGLIHRVFDRIPKLLRLVDRAGAFRPVVDENIVAMSLRNNRCGAIRINVKGREPNGAVEPAEVDALVERISASLQSLRHPVSGEPIVAAVHRPHEVFGPDHHPDIPDLMVAFRQDLGLLDGAVSDQLGVIERPVWTKQAHRTGDHTDRSHVWARVDGLDDRQLAGLTSLDIAPFVERLLGASVSEATRS